MTPALAVEPDKTLALVAEMDNGRAAAVGFNSRCEEEIEGGRSGTNYSVLCEPDAVPARTR